MFLRHLPHLLNKMHQHSSNLCDLKQATSIIYSLYHLSQNLSFSLYTPETQITRNRFSLSAFGALMRKTERKRPLGSSGRRQDDKRKLTNRGLLCHDNETSDSIKCGEFVEWVVVTWLLKKGSDPLSQELICLRVFNNQVLNGTNYVM